jgi:long-chain acyl-CoA synthetase
MADNDNTSLLDFLQAHSRATGDAACITCAGETLSYAELDQRSSALAAALCRSGVNKGDRVAILARNSVAFYELIFACAKTGAIMLPINWRLSGREIAGIITDGKPMVVLVDPDLEHLLVASSASVIALDDAYDRWRDAPGDEYSAGSHSSARDTLLLLYTSGTTGIPKGVMLCHDNLLYSARMAREIWSFSSNSVNLVAMPLFHIGGIGYGMMALTQGGHTVLLQQPEPAALLAAIERYAVTHAFFVPAVIQSIVDSDGVDSKALSSLELIVYGASPISETLLLRAIDVLGCGFTHAYGLTETSGTVITLTPEAHDPGGPHVARLKSCGQPLPWVEVALFDPDTEETVAVGEVGEIWIRSGMNMLGYWGKPAETAATLRSDNWLRTGRSRMCCMNMPRSPRPL